MPTSNTEGGWSCSLAEYIRHNDMPICEAADKALKTFQEEFMPVETFSEFLDVAGQCQGFTFRRSSATTALLVLGGLAVAFTFTDHS